MTLPTEGADLARCLANLVEGFTRVRALCPEPPVAISFAFPGPADYPAGIIGDLPNLPAFRGGVALGEGAVARGDIPDGLGGACGQGDLAADGGCAVVVGARVVDRVALRGGGCAPSGATLWRPGPAPPAPNTRPGR